MTRGHLSKDRKHMARLQRERRARFARIDYMPSPQALALIEGKRAQQWPGSAAATNSAVINTILAEWSSLTGQCPKRRVSIGGNAAPELIPASRARAGANDSGASTDDKPEFSDQYARARMSSGVEPLRASKSSVACAARRCRDGRPCQAKSEPGKKRCRFHGGRSTGPRTTEGKAKALANLRQNVRVDGQTPTRG